MIETDDKETGLPVPAASHLGYRRGTINTETPQAEKVQYKNIARFYHEAFSMPVHTQK
ncbi:MAG: hypothetical protein ACLR17_22735 [Enterobacteriaceae bacterium]